MQLRTILRIILIPERNHVTTETRTDTDPQRYLLSTVRQSQAAVIDTLRAWTTITEQLTHTLRFPVPGVDFALVTRQTVRHGRRAGLTPVRRCVPPAGLEPALQRF